jgi:hypothetical protein
MKATLSSGLNSITPQTLLVQDYALDSTTSELSWKNGHRAQGFGVTGNDARA